jgi:branched-chain amino acid transport system ATP-binding protein
MLELMGATTGYGNIRALTDVSISISGGEAVGILGANGAGKTTLMRAIAGILPLWSGSISLEGKEVTKIGPEDRATMGVSLCPEGRGIFSTLTVEQNLRLGAIALRYRLRREESWQRVDQKLKSVYMHFPILAERRKSMAGTLSGGQQQMLAIGRSLMSDPQLLLLDEPSLGLAPRIVKEVYEILQTLRAQGQTLVVVEESPSRALGFVDRAYVLRIGRIYLEGLSGDLQGQPQLAAAYLGGGGASQEKARQ